MDRDAHLKTFYVEQHREHNERNPDNQVSLEKFMEGRETSKISQQKISEAVSVELSGKRTDINIYQKF